MLRQANKLLDFVVGHENLVLDKIYEHYQSAARDKSWMADCGVQVGLKREQLGPYLDHLSLAVDRDRSEPTIYVIPKWDHQHAIYLAVRRGRAAFQDF
jgi:hypothetical protein